MMDQTDAGHEWIHSGGPARGHEGPAVVGDALYLATANRLYLIAARP
jgi:hypothetical protein